MNKKLKSKKGGATLIVTVTLMFLLSTVGLVYGLLSSQAKRQLQDIVKIQNIYSEGYTEDQPAYTGN